MYFFEEWPERKVNSVCFLSVVTYYQTISLLITLIDKSDEIYPEKWFQVLTWNVFKYQGFVKIDSSGFLKLIVLFWGLLLTCPDCLQFQFLTWFSQHLYEVIIIAERKTKILTPGPQERRVIESLIESVFSQCQLCDHYLLFCDEKKNIYIIANMSFFLLSKLFQCESVICT